MMWKLDFRRDTLAWLLGVALAIGIGIHAVELLRGGEIRYPLTVVEHDPALEAFRRQADSIMAVRRALQNAPLDINAATAAQFETLDGIGPVLAQRIVDYRERHGLFRSVDDLDKVSGIGPKRLEAMRARCTIGTP